MRLITRLIIVAMCVLTFPVSQAETPRPIDQKLDLSAQALEAREDIAQVLSDEAFGRDVTKKSWRFKSAEDLADDEEIPDWLIQFVEFLEKHFSDTQDDEPPSSIGLLMASGLEFLLWVAGISLLLFLLYHYRDYLKAFARAGKLPKKAVSAAPAVLFGLDVRKESVPENVPEQVLALWRQGEAREALGLLYRATLSRLIHQYHFTFNESATEKECADLVRHSGTKELDSYMQGLTRTWQRLAYGHRLPDEQDVIGLCKIWPVIFADGNPLENQRNH